LLPLQLDQTLRGHVHEGVARPRWVQDAGAQEEDPGGEGEKTWVQFGHGAVAGKVLHLAG